jgi:hypothetical protein
MLKAVVAFDMLAFEVDVTVPSLIETATNGCTFFTVSTILDDGVYVGLTL